ncbi:MAG: FkbM family methyltransferase [Candidatus Bilamarchaeaceae archaeon]
MTGVLPDGVSSLIYLKGFFEDGLTRMVMERVDEGMTFLDIGAHCGYFSVLASDIVGERGQVHSFEPTKSIFEVLSENAKRRGNITANNIAVFSRKGELEFKDFGIRYSAFNSLKEPKLNLGNESAYQRIKIRAITVDEYVKEKGIRPDFVKIDAEGAELEILKGMERTIAEFRPAITLEVSADEDSASKNSVEYLVARGYAPYHYENGKLRAHKVQEKYGYDNILFIAKEKIK